MKKEVLFFLFLLIVLVLIISLSEKERTVGLVRTCLIDPEWGGCEPPPEGSGGSGAKCGAYGCETALGESCETCPLDCGCCPRFFIGDGCCQAAYGESIYNDPSECCPYFGDQCNDYCPSTSACAGYDPDCDSPSVCDCDTQCNGNCAGSQCIDIDPDCNPNGCCGDGTCDTGESCNSCSDCYHTPALTCCGNGICNPPENDYNCGEDCEPQGFCGDRYCSSSENCMGCSQDCSGWQGGCSCSSFGGDYVTDPDRLGIIFLGCFYEDTPEGHQKFKNDTRMAYAHIRKHTPFGTNPDLVNYARVDVLGSDFDNLINCNPDWIENGIGTPVDFTYAFLEAAQCGGPIGVDQIVVAFNIPSQDVSGRAYIGGMFSAFIADPDSHLYEIRDDFTVPYHELGHTIGSLQDEYMDPEETTDWGPNCDDTFSGSVDIPCPKWGIYLNLKCATGCSSLGNLYAPTKSAYYGYRQVCAMRNCFDELINYDQLCSDIVEANILSSITGDTTQNPATILLFEDKNGAPELILGINGTGLPNVSQFTAVPEVNKFHIEVWNFGKIIYKSEFSFYSRMVWDGHLDDETMTGGSKIQKINYTFVRIPSVNYEKIRVLDFNNRILLTKTRQEVERTKPI